MQPFVLAHPSRSSFATIASSDLEPAETKVMAYLEERGIGLPETAKDSVSASGVTGSWEKKWVSTPLQTVATLNPPDFTADERQDEKLEHSNNDD